MRWQLIAVAVCMASASADACPLPPSLTVAGEAFEWRAIEPPFGGARYDVVLARRVPSHPRIYLQTQNEGWARYPVFHRADGSTIPFVVEPTPIEGVLVLTLAIDHGSVDVEFEHYEVPRLVVRASTAQTRRARRLRPEGSQDHWRIDSDTALFRIETPGQVEYRLANEELYVDAGATVTAIYPDGREEVLGGGEYLYDLPLELPWWALGLVLAGVGSVWLTRRITA